MKILKLTLSDLLSSKDQTIYRNSMSILKRLQRIDIEDTDEYCHNPTCPLTITHTKNHCQNTTDLTHVHDWDNYGKCTACKAWDVTGERL